MGWRSLQWLESLHVKIYIDLLSFTKCIAHHHFHRHTVTLSSADLVSMSTKLKHSSTSSPGSLVLLHRAQVSAQDTMAELPPSFQKLES